jgi:hypothetical protein
MRVQEEVRWRGRGYVEGVWGDGLDTGRDFGRVVWEMQGPS